MGSGPELVEFRFHEQRIVSRRLHACGLERQPLRGPLAHGAYAQGQGAEIRGLLPSIDDTPNVVEGEECGEEGKEARHKRRD